MAQLIARTDWSGSPIGSPEQWPQSLKTTVGLMLPAAAQIVLFWGPEFVAIYNDAYAPTIGEKHPRALGRPAQENWSELWFDLAPLLQSVRDTGDTVSAKDRPFYIERHGYPETVYFDISYSAVPDESGAVGGVLCIVSETTDRVLGEQALRENEERLRLAVENAEVGFWDVQEGDGDLTWPARTKAMFGISADVPVSMDDFYGGLHPDDLPRVAEAYAAAADPAQRAFYDVEYRTIGKEDGVVRWVAAKGGGVFDGPGPNARCLRVIGTAVDITPRKRAEEAARESEARLRAALEASESGTFRWDIRTNELEWDDALDKLFGLPPGVTARSLDQFIAMIHPDDRAGVVEQCESCAKEGADFQREFRVVQPDGTVRWLYDRGKTFFDEEKRPSYMTGACVDVTERKLAETALHEESANLEVLNRTGAAIAGELELERLIQLVTDAGVELTGAEFGSFFYNVVNDSGESYMLYTLSGVPRSAFEKFPMPRNTKIFAPTFAGEGIVRSDDITKDPRYGQNAPHFGKPEGHLPVVSYLAVPVTGRTGEVIGGLFFGHSQAAQFDERHGLLMEGIAAQAAVAIDNARLYRAAQREIEQRVNAEQALTALNETLESRVAEEISRRAHAEEGLRQAQKMETVGQLSGGIAHDFNNLLQVIQGNLSIVDRSLEASVANAKLRRNIANALTGTERAAALTKRLLAFSRRQPLDAKSIDVNRLITDMTEMLERTLGETVTIETKLAADIPNALVDANQLENAILNLAINARDAMPRGGKVEICTSASELDVDEAEGPAKPGCHVLIEVRDTGHGMSEEVRTRAVEPFFSTKDVGDGTGLGLSMVYGFIRQSGGHFVLNSREGAGTTVEMYLPCSDSAAQTRPALRTMDDLPAGHGERILLCEDDDDVRFFSSEALKDLGYEVIEAHDAASALAALTEQGSIDLLFTDVVLPGGKTGADLAREARKLKPDLKVLFTTGYARSALDREQQGERALQVLLKPFGVDQLAAKVREMLS